jgi:hypothetical protein
VQIKFDRFLALTTMLASAQLNSGCITVDDGDDSDANKDSGTTTSASDTTGQSSDSTDTSNTTGNIDATLTRDGGTGASGDADVADAGDGGVLADSGAHGDGGTLVDGSIVGDGGVLADGALADGAVFGDADVFGDAGGEGNPDPSGESTPDAGGEGACDLGDFADETMAVNCGIVGDTCFETAYQGVGTLCTSYIYDRRASVVQAFWDCYTALDIADPCTEEAETAAYLCADAADEGICVTPLSNCVTIDQGCSGIGADYCEYALASYNSLYVESVAICVAAKAAGLDPGYEGCVADFEQCVFSPSVE